MERSSGRKVSFHHVARAKWRNNRETNENNADYIFIIFIIIESDFTI